MIVVDKLAHLAQSLDLLGELNLGELVRRLFRCQALGRDRALLVDAARVDGAVVGQDQRVNAASNHLKQLPRAFTILLAHCSPEQA